MDSESEGCCLCEFKGGVMLPVHGLLDLVQLRALPRLASVYGHVHANNTAAPTAPRVPLQ